MGKHYKPTVFKIVWNWQNNRWPDEWNRYPEIDLRMSPENCLYDIVAFQDSVEMMNFSISENWGNRLEI